MERLRNWDHWVYLRALLTVRENPYLLLMSRREERSSFLPVRVGAWLLLLCAVMLGGLALGLWQSERLRMLPVPLSPGDVAAALLISAELYSIWYATSKRRYSLRAAEQDNAADHYRLAPVDWVESAGLRNTYPMLVAAAMMVLAFPLHLLCVRLGGWDDWWHLVLGHLAILFVAVAAVDRPLETGQQKSQPGEEIDTSAVRKKRRAAWGVAMAMNGLIQLFMHIGRGSAMGGIIIWVLLFPYLLPQALVEPREFYRLQMPIAVPLLLILVPSIVLWAKRMGRAIDGRPVTLRVPPWSLAGLGTIFGLLITAGFCWPWIADGWLAKVLPPVEAGPEWLTGAAAMRTTAPPADPARATDGLFVAMLAVWTVALGGMHFLRNGAVTWGILPSHRSIVEPLQGRRAWLMEIGWTLEAGLSVYVPLSAFYIACWLGGLDPRLTPHIAIGALMATIPTLMGAWVIGRGHRWLYQRGWIRAYGLVWFGIMVIFVMGFFAPPPLGPGLLGIIPFGAGFAAAPGVVALAGPLAGRFVLPSPAMVLVVQSIIAIAGTVAQVRLWQLHPGRKRVDREEKVPEPTHELIEKGARRESIVRNPVALRIMRGKRVGEDPINMFVAFAAGSLLMYLLWFLCDVLWTTGASRGSIISMIAEWPWVLATFPLGGAVIISWISAGANTSTPLKMERATGAFTHTCMTPLRPRDLLLGYMLPPLWGTAGRLTGTLICIPLFFVGTNPGLVAMVLGIVAAASLLIFFLILMTGLLGGLPGPKRFGRESMWDGLVWALPTIGLWLPLALSLPLIGMTFDSSSPGSAPLFLAVLAMGYVALIYWAFWSVRSRFERLMTEAVPQGPETELLAEISSAR
jgi:hypothetical protein